MKNRNASKAEKSSLRDYIWALKGIRIPLTALIVTLGAELLSTYAGLNISLFTGDMVDARGNIPTVELVKFSMAYLLIAFAASIRLIASSFASEKINLGLRTKLWRKIMRIPQSDYGNDCGESLVSRVTTDCDYTSKLLTTFVEMIAVALSLVINVSKMYSLNLKLANAMVIIIPVSVIFGWGYAKLSFLFGQKTQASLASTTTYLVERTQNLNLIKTSSTQQEEIKKGLDHFQAQYTMQIKNGLLNLGYSAMQRLFDILSLLIPFLIGAKLVRENVIRPGVVIAFYSISSSVCMIATNFINNIGTIRSANGALTRVINVLKLSDEDTKAGIPLEETEQDIEIQDLSFAYGDKTVLDGISCVIPKNKVTAIIGSNGSGKSTLFRLIDRLNEPDRGELRLGDKNAREYNLHEWRKAFCLVAQDSPMIEGTVRENMCYGCRQDISDEKLLEIAKLSRVYDFVSKLPDKFETHVALGGANFSGGQRQCIAIARAMLNDPKYLLLDEATSNLDAQNEHAVLDALKELMKGRTTVIIAHSLASIRHADHVIVLHNGKVESMGAPAMILNKTDNYLSKVARRREC